MWTRFDPLTISQMSIHIYKHLENLFCKRQKHEDGCCCRSLEQHYGLRPYKCDMLDCRFRRHGFPKKFSRDSHVKHHDRPWKCAVQSCEYAEIGFLSRRMRDEHLDSGHQESKSKAHLLPDDLDLDEIQPLFFDLIRFDKVEEVKSIFHHFGKLNASVQTQLRGLVASTGSAAMAQVVCENPPDSYFFIQSVGGINFETFRWCLPHIEGIMMESVYTSWGSILKALLKSKSLIMFQECEKHLINTFEPINQQRYPAHGLRSYFVFSVIEATARNSDSEKCLLSLWTKMRMRDFSWFSDQRQLSEALKNVICTTCSLALTKALLTYGAEIDFTLKNKPTPLRLAARRNSPEAAELIKLLLYQGANLEHIYSSCERKISEEKGAKQIAKWLNVSWDELVQKIKEDRENGICPPEYA